MPVLLTRGRVCPDICSSFFSAGSLSLACHADSRGSTPTCNRRLWVPTLAQTEVGGTALHSSWQPSLPGPAPCLSFLICQMGMIPGPPPAGRSQTVRVTPWRRSWHTSELLPPRFPQPRSPRTRPARPQTEEQPGPVCPAPCPPVRWASRALGREGTEPLSCFASGFPPEAVTGGELGAPLPAPKERVSLRASVAPAGRAWTSRPGCPSLNPSTASYRAL